MAADGTNAMMAGWTNGTPRNPNTTDIQRETHISRGVDSVVISTSNSLHSAHNATNGDSNYSPATGFIEPIAVCGVALRLPGGIKDAEGFWDFIINKNDARMPIPGNRFNIDGFYSPTQKPGSINFKHGYFLDCDLDRGDAGFFSSTKAEYELMDPQQRLLLEVVYEAFQDAGENNFRGKDIGVYAGVYGEDWHDLHSIDLQETGVYRLTGHGDFVLGNRISYEFDLRGPR
jgi:acyl transferase domain-containing protein